ncbi:hypothetical protein PGTUg99_026271 [Puccinia graminis f. sp. tritici]|uniref:Helicase ATP-binding domain-containing protein n=1 Tax=Puccinia graminis f. sp. tritici TaxID=56615 RepID=A0A5B0N260_PUCGR|nr:hypothetical protein PGTUg99_026271 [Puccinia graminis f. sp. tritici]
MRHLKYHGPQRHMISNTSMESANTIITSYEIVRAEFNQIQSSGSSGNSLIFSRFWFRVVLDEAHIIRTTESKTQNSIHAIKAERRLCLTGTPMQNSLHDLMALLNFICSNLKTPSNQWPEILKPYLQHGNSKPLQLILRHVML